MATWAWAWAWACARARGLGMRVCMTCTCTVMCMCKHADRHVHLMCTCTWEPWPHSNSLPPTACATLPVRTCAVLLLTLLPPIGLTLPLSWWLACPLHAGGADVSMLHNVFKGEGAAADGTRHAVRTPGRRSTPALVRRARRRHRVWLVKMTRAPAARAPCWRAKFILYILNLY